MPHQAPLNVIDAYPARRFSLTEACLLVIACGAVLRFGAVETQAFLATSTASVLLLACVVWRSGWPRAGKATYLVLAAFLGLPLLQLLPLPRFLVGLLSPSRLALSVQLVDALAPSRFLTLSVNPHETELQLLKFIGYAAVFLVAFQTRRTNPNSKVMLFGLVGLGLGQAVYGLFQFLAGGGYLFSAHPSYFPDRATGSYINPNHYAGLLEMTLPFLAALICLRLAMMARARRHWKAMVADQAAGGIFLQLFLLAVMLTGLAFSRSRVVILIPVLAIPLAAVLATWPPRRAAAIICLLLLALPVGYVFWIGADPILARVHDSFGRTPIWADTIRLIKDFPLVGTGAGSYGHASVHYQSAAPGLRYEHAHNDFLESAADLGVPAALLLFGALLVLTGRIAAHAIRGSDRDRRALAIGCATAMSCLLVHGLFDFNLQIPANALIFAWISGTAAALAGQGATVHQLQPRGRPARVTIPISD